MANIDYVLDYDRTLAMGRMLSKQFDGVAPAYMLRDSVRIERLPGDQAVIRVELLKVVSIEEATAIINGDEND